MMNFLKNKKHPRVSRGFTLVELLITMSVFVLLSTAMIANFRSVDNTLVLQNVAHQVALVVRKAQIFGISVVGIKDSAGSEIFPTYGVHFRKTDPTGFTLFADADKSGTCLANCDFPLSLSPPIHEGVQHYSLAQGYIIHDICGNQKSGGGGSCGLNRLDITFTRPNPDACFKKNPGVPLCPAGDYSDAEVVIQSKTGAKKTIVIWRTGQISVE